MSDPIEALCTVCGVRHGMPMCSPKPVRSPLVITPDLFADLARHDKENHGKR
jgi:hypothetical protein